ncbi:hypothetical protein VE00_10091 [Pseudogymnoascus sp. WSF 3629]|nr:hypothetical protein VE00_10091 [Pseudogymnoascus sp. WSF 3629]
MRLSILRANPPQQVRLLYCNEASCAKDAPGLLKLRQVRELLLVVAPNEDLNPILVLMLLEGRQRLASNVLALEEELLKQGQVYELHLAAVLAALASLDTVAPTVLKEGVVVLALLPALLLEEATDGCAAWVLCVAVAVRDLQPPELEHGRDVGVNSALRSLLQGPWERRSPGGHPQVAWRPRLAALLTSPQASLLLRGPWRQPTPTPLAAGASATAAATAASAS